MPIKIANQIPRNVFVGTLVVEVDFQKTQGNRTLVSGCFGETHGGFFFAWGGWVGVLKEVLGFNWKKGGSFCPLREGSEENISVFSRPNCEESLDGYRFNAV